MTDPVQRYRDAVDALNRGDWPRAGALADALLAERPDHAVGSPGTELEFAL